MLVDLVLFVTAMVAMVELVGTVLFLGEGISLSGIVLSTIVSPPIVASSAAAVELLGLSKSSRLKPQSGKSSSCFWAICS